MMKKALKLPLSCRVNPQLKEEIEQEAKDNEMTLSHYLELILKNRHQGDEHLKEQIATLETENAEFQEELNSISEEAPEEVSEEEFWAIFDSDDEALEEEVEEEEITPSLPVGIQISESKKEELNSYLEKLKEKYPKLEHEDLVLRSLQSALKNENSFLFTHTIEGYKPYSISLPKNEDQ